MNLGIIDRKLLNLVQSAFPLTREPYADLGRQLSIGTDEVMELIADLKSKGLIRLIGPVLDAKSVGYHTTLAAMKVPANHLDKASKAIDQHPGISHGYERNYDFNVWFTLALPGEVNSESELEKIATASGAEAAFSLPALKVFKIGVYFDMEGDGQGTVAPQHRLPKAPRVKFSATERSIINALQQDLPLLPQPFALMAQQAGIEERQFLAECQSLLQQGVIRRYGAALNHRHAGFTANAMTCWVAPPDAIVSAGQKLAGLKEVSHCYERKTNPLWRHNLFAMIHGRSRESCEEIARRVSSETGFNDCVLLYSTRELKKARIRYSL